MIAFLMIVLMLVAGCDTDPDQSVTGAYLTRVPGALEQVAVPSDSTVVATTYARKTSNSVYLLMGAYEGTDAFSLLTFNYGLADDDSVTGAWLIFTYDTTFGDGDIDLDLFELDAAWEDSAAIDPAMFLPPAGTKLSTVVGASDSVTTLGFPLDPRLLASRDGSIGFLVKNAAGGEGMAVVYGDDSLYQPRLSFTTRATDGSSDSIAVKCTNAAYFMDDGVTAPGLVSFGSASGFVLKVCLPDSIPSTAIANRCLLTVRADARLITGSSMPITVALLDTTFTTVADAVVEVGSAQSLGITAGADTYVIDMTPFINTWWSGLAGNHGIIFKPGEENTSPDRCVLSFPDSLVIRYTLAPEVE